MKKFINRKREVIWVENFNYLDSVVIVHYRGKAYKCSKKIFGTKLFPMDEVSKKFLKITTDIDVDIPYFIRSAQNANRLNTSSSKANNLGKGPSFFISPNGTCLKKMEWDFD